MIEHDRADTISLNPETSFGGDGILPFLILHSPLRAKRAMQLLRDFLQVFPIRD
jgi:hypothetical protein